MGRGSVIKNLAISTYQSVLVPISCSALNEDHYDVLVDIFNRTSLSVNESTTLTMSCPPPNLLKLLFARQTFHNISACKQIRDVGCEAK